MHSNCPSLEFLKCTITIVIVMYYTHISGSAKLAICYPSFTLATGPWTEYNNYYTADFCHCFLYNLLLRSALVIGKSMWNGSKVFVHTLQESSCYSSIIIVTCTSINFDYWDYTLKVSNSVGAKVTMQSLIHVHVHVCTFCKSVELINGAENKHIKKVFPV